MRITRLKPEEMPTIKKEHIEQFKFFPRYKDKSNIHIHFNCVTPKKELYACARNIYAFMQYFIATPELIEFLEKVRRVMKNEDVVKALKNPYACFMKRFKSVADFYDFHRERGGEVTDQRIDLLNDLKHDVNLIISFLKRKAR